MIQSVASFDSNGLPLPQSSRTSKSKYDCEQQTLMRESLCVLMCVHVCVFMCGHVSVFMSVCASVSVVSAAHMIHGQCLLLQTTARLPSASFRLQQHAASASKGEWSEESGLVQAAHHAQMQTRPGRERAPCLLLVSCLLGLLRLCCTTGSRHPQSRNARAPPENMVVPTAKQTNRQANKQPPFSQDTVKPHKPPEQAQGQAQTQATETVASKDPSTATQAAKRTAPPHTK